MGNCCRSQSSTLVWAGDDWGSFSSKHGRGGGNTATSGGGAELGDYYYHYSGGDTEKQRLLGAKKAASSSPSAGEVKIKMTKKELEDLVEKLEMQGLSLEQVIGRLVNGEDEHEVEHHRSWRPSLQSIPEDY